MPHQPLPRLSRPTALTGGDTVTSGFVPVGRATDTIGAAGAIGAAGSIGPAGAIRPAGSIPAADAIRAAGGGPRTPDRDVEGGVATETRKKTARPDKYKVLLYNDDYTPMEFVVSLLEQLFGKSPAAATQIMLAIHKSGLGVAGVYVLEIAETKVAAVHRMAEQRGYPLRSGVEKE